MCDQSLACFVAKFHLHTYQVTAELVVTSYYLGAQVSTCTCVCSEDSLCGTIPVETCTLMKLDGPL